MSSVHSQSFSQGIRSPISPPRESRLKSKRFNVWLKPEDLPVPPPELKLNLSREG